jgi:hypothetical protein
MTQLTFAFATFFKAPKIYFIKIGCKGADWIQQAEHLV